MHEKNTLNHDNEKLLTQLNKKKSAHISTGPNFKRSLKKDEDNMMVYKYVTPIKEYPAKYGPTKIKIIQDVNAHSHHLKHPINIFFNQYNEFIKLIFKNQKQSSSAKFNVGYVMGLAKALGLNLKRDAFSEQNMKSRDHLNALKEKLIYLFWRKISEENKDREPPQQ